MRCQGEILICGVGAGICWKVAGGGLGEMARGELMPGLLVRLTGRMVVPLDGAGNSGGKHTFEREVMRLLVRMLSLR